MAATTEKFGSIGGFDSLLDDAFIFKGLTKRDYPQFVTKTIRLLGQNSGLRILFAKSAEGSCFNPRPRPYLSLLPLRSLTVGSIRQSVRRLRWNSLSGEVFSTMKSVTLCSLCGKLTLSLRRLTARKRCIPLTIICLTIFSRMVGWNGLHASITPA